MLIIVCSSQDGIEEKELSSRELYPINCLDDNEFFPGDYVLSADGKISYVLRY